MIKGLLELANVGHIQADVAGDMFERLGQIGWQEIIASSKFENLVASRNNQVVTLDEKQWHAIQCGDLSKIDCIVRFDRLHVRHPVVSEVCRELMEEHGLFVSASLFLSPGSEVCGMFYHSDNYHLLAYQLEGEKIWDIPEINGTPVTDYALGTPIQPRLNSGFLAHLKTEFRVGPGEILVIPAGISHKVRTSSSTPAAHITFGIPYTNVNDLAEYLTGKLLGITDVETKFFDELDLLQRPLTAEPESVIIDAEAFLQHRLVLKFKQMGNR